MLGNPMALMGIGVCVLGGILLLAWKFWGTLGKKIKGVEKFPAQIILSEPKIKECKLNIDHSFFLCDDMTKEAWYLWPKAVQRQPDGKVAGILLTRDSCFPQLPGVKFTESDIEKMCTAAEVSEPDIFSGRVGEAVAEIMTENKQNTVADWLGLAMMGLVGCMGLIVLGTMVSSPNMPWR